MTEIPEQIRSVLQGYLEVLYLACDLNSQWAAKDLHAGFEWALTLNKLAKNPPKASLVALAADNLKPCLPHIIQSILDEAITSPTQLLLRRLLLHNTASLPSPDWTLKVLAAHTSACSLPEPLLANDVFKALLHIRKQDSCGILLHAASKDAAMAGSPSASAVEHVASTAPSWLPYPTTIASEHLEYFSKESTLELAAAAMLLRQQNQLQGQLQQQGERENSSNSNKPDATKTKARTTTTATTTTKEGIETPAPAVRAELLAMAICLSVPHNNKEGISTPDKEERKKDPLVQELCSLLYSTPSLAASLPAPLIARACRSSFQLSIEYAAALEKLQDQYSTVPVTSIISALKHACLVDDTTALLFKDALDNVYRSI